MTYSQRRTIYLVMACLALNVTLTTSAIAQLTPPIVEHPVNPDWRTVETVYQCSGEERRFSVRYTSPGFEFLGGTRKGIRLPPEEIARATEALGQLDAVTTMVPQCAPSHDSIMVLGLKQLRRVAVFIVWQDNRLQISEPQPVNF